MARAVIKMRSDISPILPALCQKILGCVYNPDKHEAIFNFQGQIVNINSRQIIINESVKETDAHELVQWLEDIANQLI